MHTLNDSTLFQFRFRHPTNTIRTEIRVSRLDTSQAAQILVAGFLPFGNQIGIGNFLAHTIIVQVTADGLAPEEQVVDVTRFLMMDLENGPQRFVDTFAFVGIGFGCKEKEEKFPFKFLGIEAGWMTNE